MGQNDQSTSLGPDRAPDDLLGPEPGGRPDRPFRFSRHVAALTAATVILTAILALTALSTIGAPRQGASRAREQLVPANNALAQAAVAQAERQVAFVALMTAPSDETSGLISATQQAGRSATAAIARFKRAALGLPGELRLVRRYEDLVRQTESAGVAAYGLKGTPDLAGFQAAFFAVNELGARTATTLDRIRTRYYAPRLAAATEETASDLDAATIWILIASGAIAVVVVSGGALLFRVARRHERVLAGHEAERRREERRASLETQLQRGLEMEHTEESTYGIIESALRMVRPGRPVELLVADSSRAHFQQAVSTTADGGPGCSVASPYDCPATSSGQTRVFLSSSRLDACPYLRSRGGESQSAVCIPMNIAGETTGVVHTTARDFKTPDPNTVTELELVARKAGERIGFLRVLARSQMQARVDPLTGLANRRSLEDHARALVQKGDAFVVAYADLDHFKQLNDAHGHEMGDRALRLFGRVLRDSLRPGDVPGRFGGEEFVLLLPDASLDSAHTVAERIQEQLRDAASGATVPAFTVSVGLASWEPPEDFGETLARADAAMLTAKQTGRNAIVSAAGGRGAEPPRSADAVVVPFDSSAMDVDRSRAST